MQLFERIKLFWKKPCRILIIGKDNLFIEKIILKVLDNKNYQVFDLRKIKESGKLKSLFNKSIHPILIINDVETKKGIIEAKEIAKSIPYNGHLILNSDDEDIREMKDLLYARSLLYGFQKKADLQVSDVNIDENGTNFKINYEGNIVPFWIKNVLNRKEIYNILSAIAVGVVKDINLVEISESLK